MSAFVPAPGLKVAPSGSFVSGTPVSNRQSARRPDTVVAPAQISAIQLPKLPNPFKKADSAPPPTPKAAPVPAAPKTTLTVGDKKVSDKPKASAEKASKANLADGLPKFYNPPTARAEYRATAKGQNATAYDIRLNPMPVPTNERQNANDTFRNMDPYTADLVWARPGWASDEARVGVHQAVKQVLGNANVFESEIEAIASSISCVTDTANMKEFVRAVGLSSLYRKRYFDSCSNTRFVESNFMNFLGRAPHSQAEISEHIQIIVEQGFNAEINSYVDSDEYDSLYGESRIPAPNFRGGHPYNNDMNKIALLRGPTSSSRAIPKSAFFSSGDTSNFSPNSIKRSLPDAWRGENKAREAAGPVMEFSPDKFWNPQPTGLREAEVAWKQRMGSWNKFWYKDSIVFTEVMTPKLTHSDAEEKEAAAVLKYGTTMAKAYVGAKKTFDVAPMIDINGPNAGDTYGGFVSLKMQEIVGAIPVDLEQNV